MGGRVVVVGGGDGGSEWVHLSSACLCVRLRAVCPCPALRGSWIAALGTKVTVVVVDAAAVSAKAGQTWSDSGEVPSCQHCQHTKIREIRNECMNVIS